MRTRSCRWCWTPPASQVSAPLHALPSLHDVPAGFAGFEQIPVAGAQVPGAWQASGAAHTTGVPAPQEPAALQVSAPLQALPSLHDAPAAFTGFEQTPVAGAHVQTSRHASHADFTT